MKFPVTEPLRRNGKTHKPPAEVELDVEQDAEEIDRLARKGVIRDVRETPESDGGQDDDPTGSEASQTEGAADATDAQGEKAQEAQATQAPQDADEAAKGETAEADQGKTDEPAKGDAAGAEPAKDDAPAKAEAKPAARKGGAKSTTKAKG